MQRHLVAILAADVAGYSRLMERDEARTHARLRAHRKELVAPLIARHGGRIVKLMGDGLLAEFPSVGEAVACAVGMQRGLAGREPDILGDERIRLRIGINLGDVIVDGDDIYGDGVNIAARLQQMARVGGICLTRAVRDQLGVADDIELEDLGEQTLKNIARHIHVFRVVLADEAEAAAPPPAPRAEKPSIVVLPFANMSGDPEQEFFADGLTEDIITELSRFHELLVISRNSAFVHKGKAVRVQDVARDLAVQYVVEGSVRKAGSRVRITVQLIDAETDRHVWAERYDRELEDIFAIQDEVTAAIVATLPARVEAATHERAKRKPTESMAAYECVLAGKVLHHRSNPADNAEAQRLLDRAIALDPKYAHAHAWKACVLGQRWANGWCEDRDAVWAAVTAELDTALSLDDNDSDVHRTWAAASIIRDKLERAIHHQERGLALNPNNDLIVVQQGELLTWLGRPEEGIEWIRKAMRLNPHHPERFWSHLGRADFVARRYAEAIEAFRRITRPDAMHHAFMAAASARLGDAAAAGQSLREVLARAPGFSVAAHLATMHYLRAEDREHHERALLEAGLPP
jgi:adenylate cyclase